MKENATQSSTEWNNSLLTQRRNRARSASVVVDGPPWPAGPSQQSKQSHWPACIPLMLQNKRLCDLPTRDVVLELSRYHITYMLKQNKGYTLSLKQIKIFSYKATSPAQAVRSLCLGKQEFQAQSPFLWILETVCTRLFSIIALLHLLFLKPGRVTYIHKVYRNCSHVLDNQWI